MADMAAVRVLFCEYLEMLATDYGNAVGCAQGQEDLNDFPKAYQALFLGTLAEVTLAGGTLTEVALARTPRAVCGLKHINTMDAELGKLYCQAEGRGHGFGRKLTHMAMEHAKSLGYTRLVLSTEPIMKHAIHLYTDMGFLPIENYQCGPSGCSRFMGIEL